MKAANATLFNVKLLKNRHGEGQVFTHGFRFVEKENAPYIITMLLGKNKWQSGCSPDRAACK